MLIRLPGIHPRFPTALGLPIRPSVFVDALDRSRLLGVQLLRQYHVSSGAELLLRDHVSWLQRYDEIYHHSFGNLRQY